SLRFPAPAGPVQVVLKKRDAANAFREVASFLVDPKDPYVDTSKPASPGPLLAIERHGDPADKVDFLILGDGYTAAERGKFEKDARRLTEILFATTPFKERRQDFNVWASARPPRNRASRARRRACTGARASARRTTPSAPSGTC